MEWLKKLFSKGNESQTSTPPTSQRATGAEPYLGDLEKTALIHQLFSIPRDKRDEHWLAAFYAAAPDASFRAGTPQVHNGPDGFPYFVLLLPEPHKAFQCYVLNHMTQDFVLEQGLGVVIEPQDGQPQWVLSYGDMVQLALLGTLEPQAVSSHSGSSQSSRREVVEQAQEVLVAQPSETFLPTATRNVLRHYFSLHNVTNMHVCLMSRVNNGVTEQSLVFDATPDRFKSEEHYQGVMRSLAWFLPRHYQYSAMARSSLGVGFRPL